uniref:Uncharacterized protein n=1 Tax=Pristionchus pacificus TaxID=54126 RepID=A0A2A6BME4_PRIPA|eukprot:PDM67079.1 hypothetical protein PRIPAC_48496 [Pristionchus pacificus]
MIQVGDTRRVAQADGRGFSKLGMEESGSESRPPVASARMENGEWRMENGELTRHRHMSFPTLLPSSGNDLRASKCAKQCDLTMKE